MLAAEWVRFVWGGVGGRGWKVCGWLVESNTIAGGLEMLEAHIANSEFLGDVISHAWMCFKEPGSTFP